MLIHRKKAKRLDNFQKKGHLSNEKLFGIKILHHGGLNEKVLAMVALIMIGIFISSCDRTGGSYEDCVLEHMKNAQGDKAAMAISQACQNKYPKETKAFTWEEAVSTGKK